MSRTLLVPAAIVLGLILLGVAWYWPSYAQSHSSWTEEKAKERQSLAAKLHDLAHGPGHSHDHGHNHSHDHSHATPDEIARHEAEVATTRQAFDHFDAELSAELDGGRTVAQYLWIAALCLIGIGGAAVLFAPGKKN